MEIVETVDAVRELRREMPGPVGLVPTMGSLHRGHMALVDRARRENDSVVATIFVNPTQFQDEGDLSAYPRELESDLGKLREAGVDLVFTPPVEEIYPAGFDTRVEVGRLAERLEGKFRPGHFRGVATVVCKLLAIVRPDRAYFGRKDFQQSLVVKRLNEDLNLGAEIVVVPTARETDGLACSSRNARLGPDEREAALVLYRSLCLARELWRTGTWDAQGLRARMVAVIEAEALARIDYVSVADPDTLEELALVDSLALVSLAVWIGKTRLIDNTVLDPLKQSE